MSCNGTVYSYAQLEGLWINAGGPPAEAPLAAAIAEAESAGCSGALNLTDNGGTQTSVGLWQVSNGTHQYPPSWLTAGGNAQEAVAKYRGAGNSFAPWGTYGSGAYRAFMNGSTTPDTNVPSAAALTGYSAAPDAGCLWQFPGLAGVGSFCVVQKATVRHVVGGLLLAGGGLIILPGVLVLAAFAFRASGGQQAAAASLAALPGPYGRAARTVEKASPRPRAAPRTASAPATAPRTASAPAGGRKIRTGRGQVSQDFADRYGTAGD